jgi:hypothetical protein
VLSERARVKPARVLARRDSSTRKNRYTINDSKYNPQNMSPLPYPILSCVLCGALFGHLWLIKQTQTSPRPQWFLLGLATSAGAQPHCPVVRPLPPWAFASLSLPTSSPESRPTPCRVALVGMNADPATYVGVCMPGKTICAHRQAHSRSAAAGLSERASERASGESFFWNVSPISRLRSEKGGGGVGGYIQSEQR